MRQLTILTLILSLIIFGSCLVNEPFDGSTTGGDQGENQNGVDEEATASSDEEFINEFKHIEIDEKLTSRSIAKISDLIKVDAINKFNEDTLEDEKEEFPEIDFEGSTSYIVNVSWGQLGPNKNLSSKKVSYNGEISINPVDAKLQVLTPIGFEDDDSFEESENIINVNSNIYGFRDGILVLVQIPDDLNIVSDDYKIGVSFNSDNDTKYELSIPFNQIGNDEFEFKPYRKFVEMDKREKGRPDRLSVFAFKLREDDYDGGHIHGRFAGGEPDDNNIITNLFLGRYVGNKTQDFSLGLLGGIYKYNESTKTGSFWGIIGKSRKEQRCYDSGAEDCDAGKVRTMFGFMGKQNETEYLTKYPYFGLVFEESEMQPGCWMPVGITGGQGRTFTDIKAHTHSFLDGMFRNFYTIEEAEQLYEENGSTYCESVESQEQGSEEAAIVNLEDLSKMDIFDEGFQVGKAVDLIKPVKPADNE